MSDFELQPMLMGEHVVLRPLRADDWDALYAIASDPLIWEQHPARDRWQEEIFREFFRGALESGGAFTVTDRATGDIIGCTRYCAHVPERSEIEIGWTFLARSHWGGLFNGEMKRMMLDHAFQFVDSVVFVIGPDNNRSRKAVEKIGGKLIDRPDSRGHVTYRICKQTVDKASTGPQGNSAN